MYTTVYIYIYTDIYLYNIHTLQYTFFHLLLFLKKKPKKDKGRK